MTRVHMIYTGIVAFVPDTGDGAYDVVVPNCRRAHHAHIPHLVVEDAHHEASPGLDVHGRDPSRSLTAYELVGFEIGVGNRIRSRTVRTNLRHVLPFGGGCHDAYPRCARLDRTLLGNAAKVAARVRLEGGSLAASWVDPKLEWRFTNPAEDWMRLAQEVCHSFEIDDEALRLDLGGSGGAGSDEWVEIEAPRGQAIEVRIGNSLPEDIFPPPGDPDQTPGEDPHVTLYHELSDISTPGNLRRELESRVGSKLPDVPQDSHEHRLSGGGIAELRIEGQEKVLSVGGANCPPATFEG